jgi:hypothetical protein
MSGRPQESLILGFELSAFPLVYAPKIETLFWARLSTPFCYEWRSD